MPLPPVHGPQFGRPESATPPAAKGPSATAAEAAHSTARNTTRGPLAGLTPRATRAGADDEHADAKSAGQTTPADSPSGPAPAPSGSLRPRTRRSDEPNAESPIEPPVPDKTPGISDLPPGGLSALAGQIDKLLSLTDFDRTTDMVALALRLPPPRRDPGPAPSHLSADGRILDLTHYFARSNATPPDVTSATRDDITAVRLPSDLWSIPQWVSTLPNLKRLDVPNFRGVVVKVSNPTLEELHVSGKAVAIADVPHTARVYGRGTHALSVRYRDLSTSHVIREGAGVGHLYFAAGVNGSINYRKMLNAKARFDGTGDEIVCRHLATDWVHKIQAHRARRTTERFVDWWAQQRSDEAKIEQSVSVHTDQRFDEILRHSPEEAHVGLEQWGKFFRDEFDRLKVGARKQCILVTKTHAMAVELLVTRDARGKRYTATLYDPNNTLNRARIVEDSLNEVERWSAGTFLTDSNVSLYFGASSRRQISQFVTVPADFYTRPMSERVFEHKPASRVLREFLSDAELASADSTGLLFRSGHVTAAALRARLAACRTRQQKASVLLGRQTRAWPGLRWAVHVNDANAIRALGEVLAETFTAGDLTDKQVFEIAGAGRTNAESAFAMAIRRADTDVVRAFGEMFDRLYAVGALTSEQTDDLLDARAKSMGSGFKAARLFGKLDAFQLLGEMVLRARAAGRLTADQLVKKLAAGYDEFSLVHTTLTEGPDWTEAMGDIIFGAVTAGGLTNQQVFDIFLAPKAERQSSVVNVISHVSAASVHRYDALIGRLWSLGALTNEQVFTLMEGPRSVGKPALHAALLGGEAKTVAALCQMFRNQHAAGALTNDELFALLEARTDDGLTGPQALTNASNQNDAVYVSNVIDAFTKAVNDARAYGQLTDTQAQHLLAEAS
ncbi:ShET2/EspL2 family type III secretion system effector toxin [Trinickia sp. LjRoot230]|uniref:ShET2/EspL2 family type III secretion system effector toxin n=1 Tax=Trinickia sp. LjRoot230 TaxID=3342288 RepID=UPI003ECC8D08